MINFRHQVSQVYRVKVHELPLGTRQSKGRAVARHMQNRGYTPDECIAVGDSREDLGAAAVGVDQGEAVACDRDVRGRAGVDATNGDGDEVALLAGENVGRYLIQGVTPILDG